MMPVQFLPQLGIDLPLPVGGGRRVDEQAEPVRLNHFSDVRHADTWVLRVVAICPQYGLRTMPTILPSGSEKRANVTPPGASVGGTMIRPPNS